MPLTLNWQFKKHFSLTTGLKTAYLLSQSTSVENSATAVYWVGMSTNSSYGLSYDKQSGDIKPSAFGLKRWDWALIGGLNYEPMRHIQLGLRYDLGLPKIFNRPNNTIRNRFVGLNVTYLF